MWRFMVFAAGLVLALAPALAQTESGVVTEDDFVIESAEDLVDLCGADPSEADYGAAIHFCHGYVSGSYHYYRADALANPAKEFVCPTETTTRSGAIQGFVEWARTRPDLLGAPAIDVLYRYLGESYPCEG